MLMDSALHNDSSLLSIFFVVILSGSRGKRRQEAWGDYSHL